MTRIKGIIAAGTLTGLILLTIFALGFRNVGAAQTTTTTPTNTVITAPVQAQDTQTAYTAQLEAALQTMQAQQAQLEAALQTMQAREIQYRQQIEAANQTIQQLQNQPAAPAISRFTGEHEGAYDGD